MQHLQSAKQPSCRHATRYTWMALLCCAYCLYSFVLFDCRTAVAAPAASIGASISASSNASAKAANSPTANPAGTERWSAIADTVFQNFGTVHGLPHPGITAVVQDGVGFLWVGTQGGLARWDGYRFRVYLPDPKDNLSLPSSSIQSLTVDSKGQLWIGTSDAGVARYDASQDKFVRYRLSNKAQASVMTMGQDRFGDMWIGTSEGLYLLKPGNGAIRQFHHDASRASSIPNDFIRSILRDSKGTMWVATRGGLARQIVDSDQFETVSVPVASGLTPNVLSLCQGHDGRIWIGTARQGAFVYDKGEIKALPMAEKDPGNVGIERDSISFMAEATPGQIWIGTYGKGVIIYDSVQQRGQRLINDASVSSSLANNWALAGWRDRSGLFWIGTRGGLSRHDPNQRAILSLFGNPTRLNKINDTDIFSIAQMPNGEIWAGSGVQGVTIIDPISGQVSHLKVDDQEFNSVRAIVHDGEGMAYLATNEGIYRSPIAKNERKMTKIPVAMPDLQVITMLADGDSIWLGAINGLWRYDIKGTPQQTITRVPGSEPLNQVVITALVMDEDGRIWVGTRNKGLYQFDASRGTTRNILAAPSDPHALSSNIIGSLARDSRGRLWVATQGGGINVMQPSHIGKQERFQRLGTEHRYSHALIDKTLEDAQGRIWVSTDDGLWLVHPDTLAIQPLTSAEGVSFPTYLGNSGVKTAEGELLFGGNGGLTVVRPELFQRKSYAASVALVDLQIGGKRVPSGRFNGGTEAVLDKIIVPAGANSFMAEFTALDFSAPERQHFAYRLEGFDQQWQSSEADRRVAAYTNLPAGDYRLRIRASSRNGDWLEHELVLPVQVMSSWYQTWWFRILVSLLLMAALFGVVHWRTRYLRQRENLLDSQVQQRTQQLQQKQSELLDTNLALNQSNSNLALSVETLRQLGEIGRELTANLNADVVFEALYKHLDNLMPTNSVVIYRVNDSKRELELAFGREEGRELNVHRIPLDEPTSYLAGIAREPRELLLEFDPVTIEPGHRQGTRRMLSALYAPMVLNERVLGVMSIQSDQPHAYGERELFIFRTLLAYVAIALTNADAMTALSNAQNQLAQQEKMASLGALVGGVAHEINTPLGNALVALSGLQGIWTQLQDTFSQGRISLPHLRTLTAEGEDYLQLAIRTATRAAELVTSFKAIASKFDSASAKDIDLGQYLPEVARLVWGELDQVERVLEVEVKGDLHIHAVQEALTETMYRVLHNVIDHGQPESQQCRAILRAYRAPSLIAGQVEDDVVIEVTDNGPGIAQHELQRAFDPFFTTKPGAGGHMGLGLHVAYNHVLQHLRGQMEIKSVPGQGTTVRIRIACSQ